ncbi:MAG: undecaprenyldiphospho-muramoylpentapeptide beta-N-acetylglucosaminyltransferase [Gammaproteobacteria bacterium]|nr:undecaprenyldiphospho-muramoylpentapeptide beta-N-acetylglucosaminyltransferase [Gammaproteobacteria bacterium]
MSHRELNAKKVLIMAGGTGGHVFPALAVARFLDKKGVAISWLGTEQGIESRVVPDEKFIDLHYLSVAGVRGQGLKRLLAAPFTLMRACWQASKTLRAVKPHLVLGMGGFASGPGGLMAWLMGYPLVVHEQNAVPGFTNRILSKFAQRVLQAFPGTFSGTPSEKFLVTGNPVRQDIVRLLEPEVRFDERQSQQEINILILGGSQGALAINELVPQALSKIAGDSSHCTLPLRIRHQAGRNKDAATASTYEHLALRAKVEPFISDMGAAYAWADLVISRSGALTVSEIQQAGVGAVFIPYPSATDDHQTKNAEFLAKEGAALVMQQKELDVENLAETINPLLNRDKLKSMALAAKRSAPMKTTETVVNACVEVICA